MTKYLSLFLFLVLISFSIKGLGQNYYDNYAPFDKRIPSPDEFLSYKIGDQHTRHDQIVSYFKLLAKLSNRVTFTEYGRTHENRPLIMLTISSIDNIIILDSLQKKHLDLVNPFSKDLDHTNLPLFINLGYNVHGNEPSGAEAALLTAYTLTASLDESINQYLNKAVFFIDPVINPDGRDRHTLWVNAMKSKNLVADPLDIEHTEAWPTGRTNHYWFDLNRDWLLAVQPESIAKLKWFHNWYPNIVTDFHEMRTSNNTFFFEPEKISGLKKPLSPKNNAVLNDIFAKEFANSMEHNGTYYFSRELYDATYPGYGSSYADLQGSLALLFEQTSTRGHLKKMEIGNLSFSETINNQYIASMTTIKTAIENKNKLYDYQQKFFKQVKNDARKSVIRSYIFSENQDYNLTKEFIKLLKKHKIRVFKSTHDFQEKGLRYKKGQAFIVPTNQYQYKMIQSIFETHKNYRDSVYYDASAWSLANFYNISYQHTDKKLSLKKEVFVSDFKRNISIEKADYAYLISWVDYNTPAFVYALQKKGITLKALTRKMQTKIKKRTNTYLPGSIIIPISLQTISKDSIYSIVSKNAQKFNISVTAINAGNNKLGINLGSRSIITLKKPKVLLWVGQGVSPYEAGDVWHLTDTRLAMPISKIKLSNFNKVNLFDYNTMLMVSGNYSQLSNSKREKIKNWIKNGNTLITIGSASSWVIKNAFVDEKLLTIKKDTSITERYNYVDATENYGKNRLGGAIFKIDIDTTHPIGYGYTQRKLPIYKNNKVWLKPGKSAYATIAKYTKDAHIDGYISKENYDVLTKSAAILASPVGKGRVILFADNPNFRGAWYGTNKLFFNALFFGNHIKVPL
jgi:lambda repressor-like predicted transcriptional regulator